MNPLDPNAPWWTKVSLGIILAYMALFLVGAIPGMPSPFTHMENILAEEITRMDTQHESIRLQHEALLSVSRLICQGVWRGDEALQRQCSGFPTLDSFSTRTLNGQH